MAILYPNIENIKRLTVEPTTGEWYLLNYFNENFNDDTEIYFQPYLNGDMPDIILMKEYYGVTIVEVKDWNLDSYYLNEDIDWVLKRNGKKILSPFQQAFRYKDNMFNLHINGLFEKKLLNKYFYGRINVFVFFSNATRENLKNFYNKSVSELKNQIEKCPKTDEKKVKYLVRKLNKTIKQRDLYSVVKDDLKKISLPKKSEYLFENSIYSEFKRYLQPPFHTKEQGVDILYNKKQKELSISSDKHQKVKGVAGSGKTIILAKRAVNAHRRHGGKILILTFNITLASYIHDMISKVRDDFNWGEFTIINYHNFFTIMANNYEIDIKDLSEYENEQFFENCNTVKFKSVFIDEIQDYHVSWIKIIKNNFLELNGEFVVFGDEKQNIYNIELANDKKPNTTIAGAWNALNQSFRLSTKIATMAEKFQKLYFSTKYDLDSIEIAEQLSLFTESNIIKYIESNCFDLENIIFSIFNHIKLNNIHPNDICILCYKIETLRCIDFMIRNNFNEKTMTTFEKEEEYQLIINENKDTTISETILKNLRKIKKYGFRLNNGMIKLSTIQSFKGWESPTIFLLISEDPEEAIYTGITRARNNLIVIGKKDNKYNSFFKQEADN